MRDHQDAVSPVRSPSSSLGDRPAVGRSKARRRSVLTSVGSGPDVPALPETSALRLKALLGVRPAICPRTGLHIGAACAGLLGDTNAASALITEIKELVPNISRISVESTAPFVRLEDRTRYLEGLAVAGLD
jgi:hypothetical protein